MPKKVEKKQRRKSNCWLFYRKVKNGGLCRLCNKEIKTQGNTTNLLNHLKRKHTVQWESAMEGNEDAMAISYMENEDEDRHEDESEQHRQSATIKTSEETHHTTGLTFQSQDGNTVIWLQPGVQLEQNSHQPFEPQITVVESTSVGEENTTILSNGEVIQNVQIVTEHPSDSTEEQPNSSSTETAPDVVINEPKIPPPRTPQRKVVSHLSPKIISYPSGSIVRHVANQGVPMRAVGQNSPPGNLVPKEDSFDHFGRYMATLLRNLPSRRSACRLQKEMINWVLKEQMMYED